jgi:hypothetical protein
VISVIRYGELPYGAAYRAQQTATLERLRERVHFLPAMALPETAAGA